MKPAGRSRELRSMSVNTPRTPARAALPQQRKHKGHTEPYDDESGKQFPEHLGNADQSCGCLKEERENEERDTEGADDDERALSARAAALDRTANYNRKNGQNAGREHR